MRGLQRPLELPHALDGTTIQAENNINYAYFNDPIINERLHAARQLAGDERYAAFQEIEHDLVLNYAPHAAMRLYNNRYFFSQRIGGHDLPDRL